jgi:hypothetical protein
MEITIEEMEEYRKKLEEELDAIVCEKISKWEGSGYTAHGIVWLLHNFNIFTGKKKEDSRSMAQKIADSKKPVLTHGSEVATYRRDMQ